MESHRAERHVDIDIVACCASELVFASRHPIASVNVFCVTQMQKCPKLGVATHNDVASPSTVATVRAAFWDVFLAAEVQRTCSALARTAENLNVINEIRGHETEIMG